VPGPGSKREHPPAHPAAVHPAGLQRGRARPLLRSGCGQCGGLGDADGRCDESGATAVGPGDLDLLRELRPMEPPLGRIYTCVPLFAHIATKVLRSLCCQFFMSAPRPPSSVIYSFCQNCWKFLQNSPLMAWPEGKGAPAWAVSDHGGRGDNVMTATSPTAAANAAAGKRRKLLTGNDNSNNRKKPGAAEADAAAAAVGAQQELAANVPSSKEGGGRGGESSKDAGKGDGGGGGIEEAPEKERAPLVGGGETSRLVSLYDVWTDAAFANFSKLPGVGLFLIIKKGCNPKVGERRIAQGSLRRCRTCASFSTCIVTLVLRKFALVAVYIRSNCKRAYLLSNLTSSFCCCRRCRRRQPHCFCIIAGEM